MTDNTVLPVFGGGTETFANNDIGGVKYPRMKVTWGPAGTANDADIATGKPLPVQIRSATGLIPLGEPTDAKNTATDTTSVSIVSILKQISASIQAAAASLAATILTSHVVSAATGGLASTARLLSAANTTNGTNVKGSAGRVYGIYGYNAASAVRYIKLYNKATAPTVGTDTPVITVAVAPSAAFSIRWGDIGRYFDTGIGFGLTTGSADNDTGALTSGDIVGMNVDYA